jgi:hypothetical protein
MALRTTTRGRAFSPAELQRDDRAEEEEFEETPLHARIRERAYQIFARRGRIPGDPLEDWLKAEREVIDEMENQAWSP